MSVTFNCLACGRLNPVRGANYSNKYCNNKCQQDHRRQLLAEKRIVDWKSGCGLYVWKEVPDYIQNYLIEQRGHKCEVCNNSEHIERHPGDIRDILVSRKIPLTVTQWDGDIYNNKESNLRLICPNCQAIRKQKNN